MFDLKKDINILEYLAKSEYKDFDAGIYTFKNKTVLYKYIPLLIEKLKDYYKLELTSKCYTDQNTILNTLVEIMENMGKYNNKYFKDGMISIYQACRLLEN